MKMRDLNSLEEQTVGDLRARSKDGDNEAARVLLEHIDRQREHISKWVGEQQQPRRHGPEEDES